MSVMSKKNLLRRLLIGQKPVSRMTIEEIGRLIVRLALIFVALATLNYGCVFVNDRLGLPADHPVEELIEDAIKDGTGVDLDLTPGGDPDDHCDEAANQ